MKKAKEEANDADLILYVADSSVPLDENDREILSFIQEKRAIILLNKNDLQTCVGPEDLRQAGAKQPILSISARREEGMEELERVLKQMFLDGEITSNDEVVITNLRHRTCLEEARTSLCMVKQSIDEGMPEDFYTIDLMEAYTKLGYILGEEVEEDLVIGNAENTQYCFQGIFDGNGHRSEQCDDHIGYRCGTVPKPGRNGGKSAGGEW